MPLLATCPRCGATAPVSAYLADEAVRTAWTTLTTRYAAHPALLARVLPYLDLHAPAESRMHYPKLARLLAELADLIEPGTGGPAGLHPGHWALAMDAALDAARLGTLRTPLPDGFGWLQSTARNLAADTSRQASARELLGGAPVATGRTATPPEVAAADDLREITADIQHWERLASLSPASAAVLDSLKSRYRDLTGHDWGTP